MRVLATLVVIVLSLGACTVSDYDALSGGIGCVRDYGPKRCGW